MKTYILKDVLIADRHPVIPMVGKLYSEVGVRSFGRGLFRKPSITFAELGAKRVFSVVPDRLIFNIVFAWEGAVARTTMADRGAIVSHRFPMFECRPDIADLNYMVFLLRSEFGLDLMRRASPGSAGRNRTLSLTAVLNSRVSLPSLPVQQEVAAWLTGIETISTRLMMAKISRSRDTDAYDEVLETCLDSITRDWPRRQISSVAEVNPRPIAVSGAIVFAPMASVSEDGHLVTEQLVDVAELKSVFRQFITGDILFARITPCMENGKTALFDSKVSVGYGSTEFYVLRPHAVSAEWLHMWVRRRAFRALASETFQGTVGQQRVPRQFFDDATIPLPPDARAEAAVLLSVKSLLNLQDRYRNAQCRRGDYAHALLSSALNQVFGSMS